MKELQIIEVYIEVSVSCSINCCVDVCAVGNGTRPKIDRWRRHHVRRPIPKLLEVMGVTLLMTIVSFVMPMMWGACTPKPVDMEDWTTQVKGVNAAYFYIRREGVTVARFPSSYLSSYKMY